MSLFDSASLVVTPNGYKEDKLYAIKPTDGSGDLTVTRATTATRVNSAGLIEVAPYNLLLRSQEFDNAVWAISGTITKTANSVNAPNGTLTADTILGANASSYISQSYTGTNGVVYTNSFFIKNNNSTQSSLLIRNSVSTISANINWSGSVLTSITNGLGVTTFEDYGNGWYRIISTYTALEDAQIARIYPTTSTNQSVYLWGAQLVTGSSAKEYFPTTDRLDVPRLDYTNSTCPSILVEPQRTNLAKYSDDFSNASWTKSSATITANTSVDPTGNTTADTLVITSGGSLLQSVAGYSAVSGQSITISIFAKNQTTNFLTFGGATAAGTDVYSIQDYGSGWYRHIRTRTFTTTATTTLQYIIFNQIGTNIIWGAQIEAGANATSYIPTVSSSVTRNADVISKTGISSLIGQTEGTIYWEGNLSVNTSERRLLSITTASGEGQRIIIWTLNNLLYTNFNAAGVNLGNFPIGTTKIAIGYTISGGSTTYSIKVNNNTLVTGTAAAAPTSLSSIALGSQLAASLTLNDRINSAILFKTRLTDTELATLTTL